MPFAPSPDIGHGCVCLQPIEFDTESNGRQPRLPEMWAVNANLKTLGVEAQGQLLLPTLCGRLSVGKGDFELSAELVGAAMCPAYRCGADGPQAIMPRSRVSGPDQFPQKSHHLRGRYRGEPMRRRRCWRPSLFPYRRVHARQRRVNPSRDRGQRFQTSPSLALMVSASLAQTAERHWHGT